MKSKLVGEIAGNYSTVVLMFGFAIVAMAPALLISRMISPRKKSNPVKFLPMECGQVPSGEGRTHFMMQYYPYILMFVIFDVVAIFLYAWGSALLELPKSATLPMLGFLAIILQDYFFYVVRSYVKLIMQVPLQQPQIQTSIQWCCNCPLVLRPI